MDDTEAKPHAARRDPNDAAPASAQRFDARQHLDRDTFSDFLDNGLGLDERAAAGRHLDTCPDCRRELADLRATVALMRALPQYAPRRSFQLGPEHARAPRPSPWTRFLPAFPAMRAATIAVALLLVVVSAGDFVTGSRPADEPAVIATSPALAPLTGVTGAEARALQGRDELETARPAPADGAADAGFDAESNLTESDDSADEAEASLAAQVPTSNPAPAQAPAAAAEQATGREGEAVRAESRAQRDGRKRPSAWRIAEVALALTLLWLLVGLVGVQRLRRSSRT